MLWISGWVWLFNPRENCIKWDLQLLDYIEFRKNISICGHQAHQESRPCMCKASWGMEALNAVPGQLVSHFFVLVFIIQFNAPGFHILQKFNNEDWYFPIVHSYSFSQGFTHYWLVISFLPVAIPLKSELAYEIFDKGQVRFWLQAEHLSPDASYRFIINDREVSDSEVSSCVRGLWLWRWPGITWEGQFLKAGILGLSSSLFEL